MTDNVDGDIREVVRRHYADLLRAGASCCGPTSSTCCGQPVPAEIARSVGYLATDLESVPDGANLGFGCGNPLAFAELKEGNVVVDLGCGAGFDCFLAARRVGPAGRVIGVDMTPEMVARARALAARDGFTNVEFRLGEIEHLPVADAAADVVISNCVINLSPDKPRVFAEALRVLKPSGRLFVSDLVLCRPLPAAVQSSLRAYVGCIAGAWPKHDYLVAMTAAGFEDVRILEQASYPLASGSIEDSEIGGSSELSAGDLAAAAAALLSIRVGARKPTGGA